MLPGWYGTGSAFEQWITAGPEGETERVGILHDLYERWPFFRSVLSNMAQVLAKSDLAWRPSTPSWWPTNRCDSGCSAKIADEHQRTIAMHKLITGSRRPAGRQPGAGALGVQPFPVSGAAEHLQVELPPRYRSGDDNEFVQRGILLTMNGLASALRNSG